nr:hypothetical protein [Chromobacterium alticapitis]
MGLEKNKKIFQGIGCQPLTQKIGIAYAKIDAEIFPGFRQIIFPECWNIIFFADLRCHHQAKWIVSMFANPVMENTIKVWRWMLSPISEYFDVFFVFRAVIPKFHYMWTA